MRKKGFIGAIVLAVLIFGGIILALLCTSRVPAGYVGVVYNMNGGVDGEVLSQGWNLVAPTKKVTTYSIGRETARTTRVSVFPHRMVRQSELIWSSPTASMRRV